MLGLLVKRGYLRVTRVEPARHGSPRRWVALTDEGRALATAWSVMRRETVAAQRFRDIVAVLNGPAEAPLRSSAVRLDERDVLDGGLDVSRLVDAVLGG